MKYVTKINKQIKFTYLYIILFIIFTGIFLAIFLFQYLAYSSINQPVKNNKSIYMESDFYNVWNYLNIIELLWGMYFLRDTCKKLLI